jgi:hypothetical protein
MNFRPLTDNASRQVIDSSTIWAEYLLAKTVAKPFAGGMYWKKEGVYEYLVKTFPGNKRERVGPRTPELEVLFQNFHSQKEVTKSRLSALSVALDEAQRVNKALRAGRVPDIVVKLLNGFDDLELAECFLVAGTNALFAYEAAAGVRIAPTASPVRESDILSDARRLVTFIVDKAMSTENLLYALKHIDVSFRLRDEGGTSECIVNSKGFEVNFTHPLRDAHRVQRGQLDKCLNSAVNAASLANDGILSSYRQTVISSTGKMATMRVLTPTAFIDFSTKMARQAGRAPHEGARDLVQAAVVQEMLDARMLTGLC